MIENLALTRFSLLPAPFCVFYVPRTLDYPRINKKVALEVLERPAQFCFSLRIFSPLFFFLHTNSWPMFTLYHVFPADVGFDKRKRSSGAKTSGGGGASSSSEQLIPVYPFPRVSTRVVWKRRRYHWGVVGLHEEIEDFIKFMEPTRIEQAMRDDVLHRIRKVITKLWVSLSSFL